MYLLYIPITFFYYFMDFQNAWFRKAGDSSLFWGRFFSLKNEEPLPVPDLHAADSLTRKKHLLYNLYATGEYRLFPSFGT